MGRPDRLRYQVDSLAEHLRADSELVRYHLSTALVVIGSACPERLTDAREALVSCLEDESRYVRGRQPKRWGCLPALRAWKRSRKHNSKSSLWTRSLLPSEPGSLSPSIAGRNLLMALQE